MSAESIARWNAIPLSRETESSLKRARQEDDPPRSDDDEDDDNISIVSRTPSPQPMDVDGTVTKYDEYIRGAPQEVITVETKIKPSNKGFMMLAKLGWAEGMSLGISGDGRVDPIPFQIKRDLTGLGKTNQDVRMIETTVSQRRELDSERQQKETEDQRRAREDLVARKSALQSEISTTLKAFYCTLCEKQFKTVAQYDEHTNSYAHHHKARFKDMQANIRLKPKEEIDRRKEKERRREEKELRKIAAANGIKMAKPNIATSAPLDGAQTTSSGMEVDTNPQPPKRAGWASLSAAEEPTKPAGRVSVGETSLTAPPTGPLPPTTLPASASHNGNPSAAPAFRNAGWISLDTESPQTTRPPASIPISTPPSRGGWINVESGSEQPSPSGEWSTASQPTTTAPPLPPSQPPEPPVPVRSGWQQFQRSNVRRR